MSVASLQEVLDNLSDMPTLPDVVAKLTQLIADPRTTTADINGALSHDPGLSAKILRIVNSSYYGFARRIATITNAVVILGYNQVWNLALSAFVFDNFSKDAARGGFNLKDFWRHSLGAALVAAKLARKIDARLEEDAFICALLHDLGKCVMAQQTENDLLRVKEMVKRDNILFLEAERRLLEYDHAALGAAVIERWNLPEVLVEVIRHHHQPLTAEGQIKILASIVNVADIMSRALLMGSGGDNGIPRLEREVWDALGLDWAMLEQAARQAAAEFNKSGAFFAA